MGDSDELLNGYIIIGIIIAFFIALICFGFCCLLRFYNKPTSVPKEVQSKYFPTSKFSESNVRHVPVAWRSPEPEDFLAHTSFRESMSVDAAEDFDTLRLP